MSPRPDLLHLSAEALVQITNAGVVKRAVRELEGGYRPQCMINADDALIATFPDAIVTTWPAAKPIGQTTCTCGAVKICRHRIIAVLTFREEAAPASATEQSAPLSPGHVSDEKLEQLIPRTLLERARQQLAQGLTVEVRRKESGEPCDTARLPASTVRFWAGAAVEAARCDCIQTTACEHVALAAWAFRKADTEYPDQPAVQVRLGEKGARLDLDRAPYDALLEKLTQHGVSTGPSPLAQSLTAAYDAARHSGAVWLTGLLGDLERWSAAYTSRSALYEATDGVRLVAELALRLSAGSLPGNAKSVLGIGEAQETELDQLRLMCLGARTSRDGENRRTRVMLADVDTATRLVLSKDWSVPEAQILEEERLRAAERLAPGVRLVQLAQGQLLAQQAKRLADGTLKLAGARSSQNSVLPQAADWGMLGTPLRFTRVADLIAIKRAQPTAQLLPRHAAGPFIVFTPARAESVFYDPNEQALLAVVYAEDEHPIIVRRVHESHLPHALDSIAGVFTQRFGALRHVAGILHWERGMPVIEPWAFACDGIIVPDVAGACGALKDVELGSAPMETTEPLSQSFAQLREWIAALLHHGAIRLPQSWAHDGSVAYRKLSSLGLHELAQRCKSFTDTVQESRSNPADTQLALPLMQLLALLQLHEDAHITTQLRAQTAA